MYLIERLSYRVVITHVKCIVTTQAEAQISGILEKQKSRIKDRFSAWKKVDLHQFSTMTCSMEKIKPKSKLNIKDLAD